jgi:hypothetical protein
MTQQLTIAQRLRVYAKSGPEPVTITMTPAQAEYVADMLDIASTVEDALARMQDAQATIITRNAVVAWQLDFVEKQLLMRWRWWAASLALCYFASWMGGAL